MRGAPSVAETGQAYARIIPAYAGSTGGMIFPQDGYQDHPRVCGEHLLAFAATAWAEGSSPRMRGAPAYLDCWDTARRIIPAYAGSTG